MGEVVWFSDHGEQLRTRMVVVNLPWLCSEVIGPILAPPEVGSVAHLRTLGNDAATAHLSAVRGLFMEERAARGLKAFSSDEADAVVRLLQVFELCFESKPDHLTFPCRLAADRPPSVWSKTKHEAWHVCGRR